MIRMVCYSDRVKGDDLSISLWVSLAMGGESVQLMPDGTGGDGPRRARRVKMPSDYAYHLVGD